MKRKNTLLLYLCLLCVVGIKAQTVGTTSTNPIVVTAGTTSLTNQSPDANQKWYNISPAKPNVVIKSKLTTQSYSNSLVWTELFVTNATGTTIIQRYQDSLRNDSTTRFVLYNFDYANNKIYLKYNFTNSCGTCTALPTKFDVFITESDNSLSGCVPTPLGCNIIKNPSFENFYTACSNLGTTLVYGYPPICDWDIPNVCSPYPFQGTTDYINLCAPSGAYFFTPTTNTGSGSIGIFTYGNASSISNSPNGDYREYINQTLNWTVLNSKVYQLSLYAKAKGPLYSSHLGGFLSGFSLPCQPGLGTINTSTLSGQQVVFSTSPLTNTTWQKYIVTFTASSNYNKLTIGNFNTNSLTVTSGTGNSAYYFIDDVSLITPTISISNPAAICSGTTLQLNPTVCELDITTYNYVWSPTVGLSSSNTLNPIFSGTTTTSYTVTQIGTGSYGTITNTAVVVVTVDPTGTFTLSSALNVICTNSAQSTNTLTASGTAGLSYTWQPGNLVGSVQTVTPSSTTIYTVNANTSTVCPLTNTILVFVQSACCTQTPAFLGTAFPTSTTGGLTYISTLVFNNDVTIPSGLSVTLSDVEYLFAPGVKIIVSPGAELKLRGSHLYACGTKLWQGIVVQTNGKVSTNQSGGTTPNYPMIEDAVEGINVSANTTSSINPILDIRNTTFNKNYVGIKIDTYQSADIPYPFVIYGCTFSSRNFTHTPTSWPRSITTTPELRYATTATTGISAPYGLQSVAISNLLAPYNTQSSKTGIELNDVGITSGGYKGIDIGLNSSAGDFNLFDNLMYGIDASNSNVSNVNAVFQNTQRVLICNPKCKYYGGNGIRSLVTTTLNTRLNLSATGTGSTSPSLGNRFWNCHWGVEANNVYQFNMDYSTHRSTQSTGGSTTTVNSGNTGVLLGTNRFQYYITNNEFTNINNAINIPIISGIYNVGSGNVNGIYAANMVIITNSFAPQTSTATAIGTNYLNNAISISGVNTTTWTNATSTSLQIKTNFINRVYRGITLNGMNGYPSLVSNNTCTLVVDGLYNATQQGINVVNTQSAVIVTTNTITGANTTSTLGNLVFVGSNNGTNSPSITCNVLSNAYQGFVFDNNNPGTLWKTNKMNAPLIRGMVLQNAGYINQQGSNSNAINNEWNGTWTGNNGTWTADPSTFANLSPLYVQTGSPYNPPLNSGNPNIQSYAGSGGLFFTTGSASCGGGGGGGMAPVSLAANTTMAPTTNSTQISDVKYLANTSQYRTYSNNSTLQSNFANSSIGKFLQIEQANYNGNLAIANSQNSAVTATNTIEQNYKNYNALYYKSATTNFTNTDSTNLIALAQLCAGTNGACVYQARALYNSIYKTVLTVKDNCTYGLNVGSRVLNSGATNNESMANSWSVDLFPNPTVSEVNIVSKTEKENLNVTITDVSGKVLVVKNLTTTNFITILDLSLNNGIYLVTITNTKNEKTTKKLVITK